MRFCDQNHREGQCPSPTVTALLCRGSSRAGVVGGGAALGPLFEGAEHVKKDRFLEKKASPRGEAGTN